METMLEKVARTTVEETGYKWASAPQTNWRATVKATILAMREPTEGIQAVLVERGISLKDYQATIDVILAEPPWKA